MNNRIGEKRILAISAHPDDIEFTSGGSLAHWIDEGWAVSLVVCTDGGKGSQDPAIGDGGTPGTGLGSRAF
jgi:LmbE family N-acetylglucosaminyl deacetylase